MSKSFSVNFKSSSKPTNLRQYDRKTWHFSHKWWEKTASKEEADKAFASVIRTMTEMSKAEALKPETRERAKLVLDGARDARKLAGKLETSEEVASCLAYQAERYANRVHFFEKLDALRTLKNPWKKVPEKKEAEPKEETKAPAKKTRKAKAPAKKEAAASNEDQLAAKLADLQAQLSALASLIEGAK
jgi:hypothetical protein